MMKTVATPRALGNEESARARPRVVVVTDRIGPPCSNGSQVLASALVESLSKSFDIRAVVGSAGGPSSSFTVAVDDGSCDNVPERLAPDLIYNFGGTEWSCQATLAARDRWPKVPILNHFQVNLAAYARTEKWPPESCLELAHLQRETAHAAELNVFPSFAELELGCETWALPPGRAMVIANAFVPAPMEPVTRRRRSDSLTFLVCGRTSDRVKGADMAYRAFSRLRAAGANARLEIVADSIRFTEILRALPVGSWQRSEWATRKDLHSAMRAADVLVVPSRYEPFGLVAVEAMAMGTPVIAMAVGGLREIVRHGATGWLCDPQDGSFGLAAAMQAACGLDPAQLREMGGTGTAVASRDFSLGQLTARVQKQIHDLLRTCAPGPLQRVRQWL